MRDDVEVAQIRENRAEVAAQAQKAEIAATGAKAAKDIAAGEKDLAEAAEKSKPKV